MKHYEMLCVLPGTMTEEEVATFMKSVTDTVTTHGATISSTVDKGKSRLAYPMKNIRYGYFQLVYFTLEPKLLADIERRIRLLGSLLRIVIRSYDPANETQLSGFSLNPQPTARMMEEQGETMQREEAPAPMRERETQEATAEEKQATLEEIDNKLDEILEKDLSKV